MNLKLILKMMILLEFQDWVIENGNNDFPIILIEDLREIYKYIQHHPLSDKQIKHVYEYIYSLIWDSTPNNILSLKKRTKMWKDFVKYDY